MLGSDGSIVEQLELTELSHLANYSQPHAPGALLKAAFICAEIVDLSSHQSLAAQLSGKFGCGFRLQSMSSLPQGSGACVSVLSVFPSVPLSRCRLCLSLCISLDPFPCLCSYVSSGLGTSSILGGAILAALWKAVGQEHSRDSLIHAVSLVG